MRVLRASGIRGKIVPEQTLSEFIPLLKELIRLEERKGNHLKLANLQNRLGVIYFSHGEIDSARKLFTASSDLAANIGDDELLVCNLQLLADCYLFSEDIDLNIILLSKNILLNKNIK